MRAKFEVVSVEATESRAERINFHGYGDEADNTSAATRPRQIPTPHASGMGGLACCLVHRRTAFSPSRSALSLAA